MSTLSSKPNDESESKDIITESGLPSALTDFFELVLDTHQTEFENYSNSVSYKFRGERDGLFILGRDEENDSGFDYAYFKYFESDDSNRDMWYLYNNEDGWNDYGMISGKYEQVKGVLKDITRGRLMPDELNNRYDSVIESYRRLKKLGQERRSEYTLADIEYAIRQFDFEFLKNIVAPDGRAAAELWKLLFSRDKDGNSVRNKQITIPVKDKNMMFVRAKRMYMRSDGERKIYPIGIVIGVEDSAERFYVNRIERDEDLDNDSFNWTADIVRQKQGYKSECQDLTNNVISTNEPVRVKKNLILKRQHLPDYIKHTIHEVIRDAIHAHLHTQYASKYIEEELTATFSRLRDRALNVYPVHLDLDDDVGTKELKEEIQPQLDISEDEVRSLQEEHDEMIRLSANRREELICRVFEENVMNWIFSRDPLPERIVDSRLRGNKQGLNMNNTYVQDGFEKIVGRTSITEEHIQNVIEETASNMTQETKQVNFSIGEHWVCVGPAIESPVSTYEDLVEFMVPNNATALIFENGTHPRTVNLSRGAYEFRMVDTLNSAMFLRKD